jgi:hypothetical protein
VLWIGLGTNLTVTVLFAVVLVVLRESQVFIGFYLSGCETAASFLLSNADFITKGNFQ